MNEMPEDAGDDIESQLRTAAGELRTEVDAQLDIDEALRRLDSGDPNRNVLLLAAAAIVAVLTVGAVVLFTGDDSNQDVVSEPEPPSPEVVADPETSGTRQSDVPENVPESPPTELPGGSPLFWVGVSEGRLQKVDRTTGEVVVLAELDDPLGPEPAEGTGYYIEDLAVSPLGDTVFYGTCCSPAVGEIFRIPVSGGEPTRVTYGAHPTYRHGTGTIVAATSIGLAFVGSEAVADQVDGADTALEYTTPPVYVWNLTSSPDGRYLAWEEAREIDRPEVKVLDLGRPGSPVPESLDSAFTITEGNSEAAPQLPTFDADNRLHVVRQPSQWTGGSGTAVAEVWNITAGTMISERELRDQVFDQSHDSSGQYLVRVFADGSVRMWSPEAEPTELGTGYTSAALP